MKLLDHLPVRTRRIACADDVHGTAPSVHCSRRGGSVALSYCAKCAECSEMPSRADARGAEVVCSAQVGHEDPRDPALDMREAMLRTTVGELLAGPVVCVHPGTSIEMAIEILSQPETRSVPVVDADAKLVGILSEGDVVREASLGASADDVRDTMTRAPLDNGFHVEAPSGRTVADVMTPLVQALPEDAPLSFAVGMMAGAGLRQVPVVGRDGRVIGMFTANLALRWVARAIGYVF